MRSIKPVGSLVLLAPMVSACVAAAVPVVVGGMAARHRVHASRSHPPAAAVATRLDGGSMPPSAPPRATPLPARSPIAVEPLPADPKEAHVGRIYGGKLPAPVPASAGLDGTAPGESVPGTAAPPTVPPTDWAALGRYVAVHLSPEHGVLLARGDQRGSPWLPCDGKPAAVLAPVALVTAAAGHAADRSWLDALHTLGVKLLAFGPAGTAAGKSGSNSILDDLLVAASPADLPAMRAGAAARYCVIALAGQGATDFPNGYTPDTTPAAYRDHWGEGWFLFPPR